MKRLFLGLVSLVLVNLAQAQISSVPLDGIPPAQPLPGSVASSSPAPARLGDDGRLAAASSAWLWGGVEYLQWWVKDAPIPPLVTTGDPTIAAAGGVPGALGQPGTQVFLGNSPFKFGSFPGMRFTVGAYLDEDGNFGCECVGFILEQRAEDLNALSNSAGNPPLYVPFFDVFNGREGAFPIADPVAGINGGIAVSSTLQLWGFEANMFSRLTCGKPFVADLLLGFRYLDLRESLGIIGNTNNFVTNVQTLYSESFTTRNQFYGGQVGARIGYHPGRLTLDLTGKVALGSMHEMVNANGSITVSGAGAANPGTFGGGGVFVQSTNLGIQNKPVFSILPQVQAKVGYDVFHWLRATVGYDFLYLTNAVRPGNQIDRNVNPTQFFGGTSPTGQPSPVPLLNRSEFFAHGVSFGLEFRY